jgi:hypothetical protein
MVKFQAPWPVTPQIIRISELVNIREQCGAPDIHAPLS